MGCGASRLDAAPPRGPPAAAYDAPGAGSIILARRASADDAALQQTKGGSYVIGRKAAGAWEPGSPIRRPENSAATSHFYMPPAPGDGWVLRLSFAAVSLQGRSPHPPNKPNQDSFLALPRLGNAPDVALFGVFDGHGPRGEDAAEFCRINLPDVALGRPEWAAGAPLDAVAGSFEALHKLFITPQCVGGWGGGGRGRWLGGWGVAGGV